MKRFLLRFGCFYLVLFFVNAIAELLALKLPLMHPLIAWFAIHLLGIHTIAFVPGSDTLYGWALVLFSIVVAILAGGLWAIVDRRSEGTWLHELFQLACATVLSIFLLIYGLDKVIPAQFGEMSFMRLMTPVGSLSHMGLLWSFMSASIGYTIFAGSIETLSAILLAIPRTRTLGAMVGLVALTNVVALNYFYNVPVKLFSSQLLLLDVIVLWPDLGRLANLLLFNKPVEPRMPSRLVRWTSFCAGIVIIIFAAIWLALIADRYVGGMHHTDPTAPLYGVWMVDQFSMQQYEPGNRWERIAFDSRDSGYLQIGGKIDREDVSLGTLTHAIILQNHFMRDWNATFTYTLADPYHARLRGDINGIPFTASISRMPPFQLLEDHTTLITQYPQ